MSDHQFELVVRGAAALACGTALRTISGGGFETHRRKH
jgi:hypothetical protein